MRCFDTASSVALRAAAAASSNEMVSDMGHSGFAGRGIGCRVRGLAAQAGRDDDG
jgi:hypothetical protein